MAIKNLLIVVRALFILMVIGLALLVGAIIIAVSGSNPIAAYYWLFYGAFALKSIPETLIRATPLLLISEGLAVAFLARIWNIGAEGQFYIGGIVAAVLGIMLKDVMLPMYPLIIIAAGVGGALWAFIPAILRAYHSINEIITTLMLNYVAIYFVSYLLHGPFRDPVSMFPETETLASHLQVPVILPGTRLHLGVAISFLLVVPLMYYFLKKTAYGLRLEILGANPKVSQYSGFKTKTMIIQAMLISGFLAGVAGGFEVLAIQHKMRLELSPSHCPYGYTGIAVALLGYLNPLVIAITSIFLGGVINGSMTMHRMALIPVGMANIIQALIIIFILISYFIEGKLVGKVLERLGGL